MKLHTLKPAEGSTHKAIRIGRGEASGKGGTSTKGHKGAQSRTGYSSKAGFEGGQMPLYRRLPKFGFKNFNRKEYKGINIEVLQMLAEKEGLSVIDKAVLVKSGYVSKNDLIKILGNGELKIKLDVTAHAFSASAVKAIEGLGGTTTKI